MTAENPEDYLLKTTLLQDVLDLVDVPGSEHRRSAANTKFEEHFGGFDLVWSCCFLFLMSLDFL